MNALAPYHSPDVVLTEALVNESTARAANLKSMTLRNVLFGSAAFVGALLLGWAAVKWADAKRLDPVVLRDALHAALANMPELKVAPVQIAEGSKVGVDGNVGVKPDALVGIRPGGEVTIAKGSEVGVHGTVGIDPDATVEVTGSLKGGGSSTPMPDMSKQPTKTADGEVIKREVVVFTDVPWKGGVVVSGWRYRSGASKQPYTQYCYHSTSTSDLGATENIAYLIRDGADSPVPRTARFNVAEARAQCVRWKR